MANFSNNSFALQSQFSTPRSPQSLPLSPYPLSPSSYIDVLMVKDDT